ncbi:uncharacterized protein LOC114031214 [Vombatus ursinus]|uniref:uncharacterized protein LOC114031214 n=1 Tax=Vombatus ursinus TaxID=29139 RepID=UPI000FFDA93A|nr:uncharacterized protein LOC114031214 [Vombatus ursinus]
MAPVLPVSGKRGWSPASDAAKRSENVDWKKPGVWELRERAALGSDEVGGQTIEGEGVELHGTAVRGGPGFPKPGHPLEAASGTNWSLARVIHPYPEIQGGVGLCSPAACLGLESISAHQSRLPIYTVIYLLGSPPLPGREGSVTFKYVAVDLSWEEWGQLGPAQKELYREVMLEIYKHLEFGPGCFQARCNLAAGARGSTVDARGRGAEEKLPRPVPNSTSVLTGQRSHKEVMIMETLQPEHVAQRYLCLFLKHC